jgi:TolB protein
VRIVGGICAAVCCLATFVPASQAAYPGRNGKIAFASEIVPTSQSRYLFTINPDGTGVKPLLPERATDPAWSPDGTRVAFTTDNREVAVVNADGSGRTTLTSRVDGTAEDPSWSPDGRKIAFTRFLPGEGFFGAFEIHTMNADGTDARRLTNSRQDGRGLHATEPAWSPDGSRIAFTRTNTVPGGLIDDEIYVMSADGTGLVNLSNNPAGNFSLPNDLSPAWSPDGTQIVFSSRREGTFGAHVMNADGSGLHRVVTAPQASHPAWSPDGTKLSYANGFHDIHTIGIDGSDPRNLTNTPNPGASDLYPDWQPIPNRPPDCSTLTAAPSSLAPANHKFQRVAVAGATDPDGDTVSITIDAVSQDEPVGPQPDARAGAAPGEVNLRAERSPKGDGRVYRISISASDGRGGRCTGVATVEVRRHQKQPAIDSAPPSYDSFG